MSIQEFKEGKFICHLFIQATFSVTGMVSVCWGEDGHVDGTYRGMATIGEECSSSVFLKLEKKIYQSPIFCPLSPLRHFFFLVSLHH